MGIDFVVIGAADFNNAIRSLLDIGVTAGGGCPLAGGRGGGPHF